MIHDTQALESHDLSGEELTVDHIHTFLTIQGHGGPPWMRDQLYAGAPRQHEHERRYTLIHSNKANIKGRL